jgi:hypothetical protein
MNTDSSFQTLGETAHPAATSTEILRTGPSSKTMRLMAVVGVGAVGVATVAGFTSMASAQTDNREPIVTLSELKVSDHKAEMPNVAPAPEVVDSPFEPIMFDQDPDVIFYNENGEFYCPPCGMG